MNSRLQDLSQVQGQSPWIDNLKRSFLHDGGLATLVARGVRGVTSNPTIFQKAIAGSKDYDAQYVELIAGGSTTEDAYWALVSRDVTDACAILAPVFTESAGIDGYVSLEVSPLLADDTDGTTAAARGLHTGLALPNLMVKIPATATCVPSIEQMIAEGRCINVTLIFSIDRYDAVMEAYLRGLERQLEAGATELSGTASVASFFVSRVDTEVDRRLEQAATPGALALRGKAAIAQAVLAYHLFKQRFSGPRWERLAAHGARPQRPLWASTSAKNPAYRDTIYVDTLIGPSSVNTLPDATLEAFDDHGTLARTIDTPEAVAEAVAVMAGLASEGIDLADVATTLEHEGVASFVKSFEELLSTLEERGAQLRRPS